MTAPDPALASAYAATTYRVFLPAGPVDLRIGRAAPPLAAALAARPAAGFTLICAANPGRRLAAAENTRREAQLAQRLAEAAIFYWPGENLADAGAWPPEASFCLPATGVAAAAELARAFGQRALLAGDASGATRLVWL